jgi:glycosyltransferase involved in cell wall biosynthesis
MRKKVAVFVGGYLPGYRYGGPVRAIENLVNALCDNFDFRIITLDRDLGDDKAYSSIKVGSWNKVGMAEVFYLPPGFPGFLTLVDLFRKEKFDVVYLNSFFSVAFTILPFFLARLLRNGLVILAPRGELSSSALEIKSFRKTVYLHVFNFLRLGEGVRWHVTSQLEEADLRKSVMRVESVRVASDIPRAPDFSCDFLDRDVNCLRVLFVARIVPIKNLDYAINVLSRTKARVIFTIYGPKEDQGYFDSCLHACKSLPSNVVFNYRGAIPFQEVSAVMSSNDLFFFPTQSENFGHVIAEALSVGLPVLISDKTPWSGLLDRGLGCELPLVDIDGFVDFIDFCFSIGPSDYRDWRLSIWSWAKDNLIDSDLVSANKSIFGVEDVN